VNDALARLRLDYRSAFIGYLSRRGERQLTTAYEIGRRAIAARVGLLDVVQIHNAVTLDVLRETAGADERVDVAEAAGEFLLEVLASSDMAQRGFLAHAESPRDRPGTA
jgi:hypothetical protein